MGRTSFKTAQEKGTVPIFLRRLRKKGAVPGGFATGSREGHAARFGKLYRTGGEMGREKLGAKVQVRDAPNRKRRTKPIGMGRRLRFRAFVRCPLPCPAKRIASDAANLVAGCLVPALLLPFRPHARLLP